MNQRSVTLDAIKMLPVDPCKVVVIFCSIAAEWPDLNTSLDPESLKELIMTCAKLSVTMQGSILGGVNAHDCGSV